MLGDLKEVYFNQYCYRCKNKETAESVEPCCDCLSIPGRTDSHKPEKYEPAN